MMIEYVILGLVKVLDNVILTAKSLAQYKEQKILSSVLVVLSQLIFYIVISKIIEDNSILAIIIVSVASGLGNLLALEINDKVKRDTKWVFVITSSDKQELKKFCDYLVENNIKYIVCDGYNRKWNETVNVMCFSKSKEESKLIENFLAKAKSRFLKEII